MASGRRISWLGATVAGACVLAALLAIPDALAGIGAGSWTAIPGIDATLAALGTAEPIALDRSAPALLLGITALAAILGFRRIGAR